MGKYDREKEFKVGDILVSDIHNLIYKKAEVNAHSYCFDLKRVFEIEDYIFLIFIYLGDNKLMEAYSKKIIEIEGNKNYINNSTTDIQKYYKNIDYVINYPLYIDNKSLERYDRDNKDMLNNIYSGFKKKDLIANEIDETIEESIIMNKRKKQELYSDSYELAQIENTIFDLKKEVKEYKMSLQNNEKKDLDN